MGNSTGPDTFTPYSTYRSCRRFLASLRLCVLILTIIIVALWTIL